VRRSGDLSETAQIAWSLAGTADAEDLAAGTATSGTLVFAPGSATAVLEFVTLGDTWFEADETLVFALGDGDLLAPDPLQGSATVTLRNDDDPDEFRITAVTPALAEGSVTGAKTSFRFELLRVGHVDTDATVQYAVTGSGWSPADAADFGGTLPAGTMKWLAGETRKTVFIAITQDTLAELDEGFTLGLFDSVGTGVSPTQGSAAVLIESDELPGPRGISGAAASFERYSLPGLRTDYQLGLEAATDRIRVVDHDPGRTGTLLLDSVELLRFADGTQLRLQPAAGPQLLLQLGQALQGAQGLDPTLFELGLEVLASEGEAGLGVTAAALLGPMPAQAMAQTVLGNLGLTPATLGGGTAGDNAWRATLSLLTTMFEGDTTTRGTALVQLMTVFSSLEADAVYGAAARTFNERIGHEWLAEFASHPAMLVGLPETVIDLGPSG
jgi:hypothetical protein